MDAIKKFAFIGFSSFMCLVLAGCSGNPADAINPLSTAFKESAYSARVWTESCLSGNLSKAKDRVSDLNYFPIQFPTATIVPTQSSPQSTNTTSQPNQTPKPPSYYFSVSNPYEACWRLSKLPFRSDIKVLGVEDNGFLLNSGKLTVILQHNTTKKIETFEAHVNNSERGSLITSVNGCCNLDDIAK